MKRHVSGVQVPSCSSTINAVQVKVSAEPFDPPAGQKWPQQGRLPKKSQTSSTERKCLSASLAARTAKRPPRVSLVK
eukprot:CAMPEP_0179194758 /NCGR_PEP_ID=MMETSP0796-20121207/96803_1 /TAXON_ID=73915 /ORGANISM="Pyrodinium bahamense, Strain pbaha01" /LENGTH=76 /DNA_ID=CAMNT_0020899095 /DNA_START=50 /DNA_END=280 /DNA_ORIENTATION=+